MVVPVWLSTTSRPEAEHLTYALLDTMSDTTFVLSDTLETMYGSGGGLRKDSQPVNLRLTTMTARSKTIGCRKFNNLLVRGFDSSVRIPLSRAYSRDFIPVERSHIPTPDTAKKWPHLKGISHRIPPLQDCEVGLLIGYDCPRALAPRNCLTGEGDEPFGVETDLGWSIVGRTDPQEDSGDAIGLTCRVLTKEVPLSLMPDSNSFSFTCRSTNQEEVLSTPIAHPPPSIENEINYLPNMLNKRTKVIAPVNHPEDLTFFTPVTSFRKNQHRRNFSLLKRNNKQNID